MVAKLVVAMAVLGGLAGCGSDSSTVSVFAAASLADAFSEIEAAFEDANPGLDVQLNIAGSSALREQILDGAPADVFASANTEVMAELVAAGAVSDAPAVFARNRLQIAVPTGNPGAVSGLGDFDREELLLGLCARGVPCGDLARAALEDAGVAPVPDTEEPDVRSLLNKVAEGELDAALVYATDVLAEADRVVGFDIDSGSPSPALYPLAVLADAANPTGAVAFSAFVVSAAGEAILGAHGFAAP